MSTLQAFASGSASTSLPPTALVASTMFLRDHPVSSPVQLQSLEDWIGILLMLEHLQKWNGWYAHPNDSIWWDDLPTPSSPVYFITRMSPQGIPFFMGRTPCIFLSPNQTHLLPDHRIIAKLLHQSSSVIREWLMNVEPYWTWIARVDTEWEWLLSESLPSVSNVLDRIEKWIPYGIVPPLSTHLELCAVVDQLIEQIPAIPKIEAIPPYFVPADSIRELLPNLTITGPTEFWELLCRSLLYVSSEERYRMRLVEIEPIASTLHQQAMVQTRSSLVEKKGWETYSLQQLYRSVLPDHSLETIRTQGIALPLLPYQVPDPDLTILNTRLWEPVTQQSDLSFLKSQSWPKRSECLLLIYFCTMIQKVVHQTVIRILYIGSQFCTQLRDWFPDFLFEVYPAMTMDTMTTWANDHQNEIVGLFVSTGSNNEQIKLYHTLRSRQLSNCWGMLRLDTTQLTSTVPKGRMIHEPWGALMSRYVRLVTHHLDSMDLNPMWTRQHMVWYHTVCRQQKRVPNEATIRRRNDLWDTQYEYDILEMTRPSSVLDWMKQISEATEEQDKYQRRYCYQVDYQVSPQKREEMLSQAFEDASVVSQEIRSDAVDHLYKMLIFRPPPRVTPEKEQWWTYKRKRELASIMGAYAYDHVKYEWYREWLRDHQLLKLSDGVSKEYLEKRHRARVRDIVEQIQQCSARHYIGDSWKPSALLDFGGDKGGTASMLAKQFGLPKDKAIVTDIDSWYGHKRMQIFSNITYLTINSNVLPFPTGQFDMILSLMVFHHIKYVKKTLQELRRIIRTGGLLFVREHDASSEYDQMAVDVEHSVHELVESQKTKIGAMTYLAYYDGFYRGIDDWSRLLSEVGFRELSLDYSPVKGWTRYVTRVYQAID